MTTASTNTPVAHSTNANFQAWINEIYTGLVTSCGLTQTADTGQMAVPSTAVYNASTGTQAGYYVFAFNDALQATSPVFIKMEFGTGQSPTVPSILITVGSGTNGAGTITGLVGTRVQITNNAAISNPGVTNYITRFVYNATQGVCGMAWKIGGTAAVGYGLGGFYLFRSVGTTGAPNANTLMIMENSSSTNTGSTGSNGYLWAIGYATSQVYGPTGGPVVWNNYWASVPYTNTQSVQGTQGQIFPVWQYAPTATTPPYGITNACAMCINSEIPIGTTVTSTVLGSTSLTYINVGTSLTANSQMTSILPVTNYGCLMLWQ